jgi:hypothetical protein
MVQVRKGSASSASEVASVAVADDTEDSATITSMVQARRKGSASFAAAAASAAVADDDDAENVRYAKIVNDFKLMQRVETKATTKFIVNKIPCMNVHKDAAYRLFEGDDDGSRSERCEGTTSNYSKREKECLNVVEILLE